MLETNPDIKLKLADIPLPNGILRVDKINANVATELRLGHYALPQIKGAIKTIKKKVKGKDVVIIDNGRYQLAMISYAGWDKIYDVDTKDVHPQSEYSRVVNVSGKLDAGKERTYITLMLWKQSGQKWKDNELVPIDKIIGNAESLKIFFKSKGMKNLIY